PNFKSVAERLAKYRVNNFPDASITNPRVKIVYTNQIYNEFSNGLLDPYAIKNFITYAFYNWTKPSPAYVVLIGDMSHDYRHVLSTSRQSFVPSLPYYSRTLGESISDNLLVAVNDSIHPDLAIGRLSCESVEEGNILVDKIINYSNDNSKSWKQNILLLSSGLSQEDEDNLHLNDASVQLEKSYVLPNGFKSTKVMRYPNLPEYSKFQGGGPEIRNNINEGAALINYFGHGGGYQWDLTFINDDIYLLNNIDRLPVILSLTCYTAHFDDQDVFGEQFNKIPRKGSVGFLGNVGLTYWSVGSYIDNLIFDEIFNKKNLITGKIFQYAKSVLPAVGYNTSQIALITYLGDPVLKLALPDKADFSISSSQISYGTMNPVVNDTVQIKVIIKNLGTLFSSDSVTVQLYMESSDSLYLLGERKLGSFSIEDSPYFTWIPRYAGTYSLIVKVNEINLIPEIDHSDNVAKSTIVVYNLSYPSIISPIDGFASPDVSVEFKMADIGYFISQPKKYLIQIDSNRNFTNPVCSPSIEPSMGLVLWKSPPLKKGIYFWRSRIYSSLDSSSWSIPRTFSTLSLNQNGYYVEGKQLALFSNYNMNISDSGLTLNKNYLPPKPSNKNFIENITINPSFIDSTGITSITTDGSYIYFGNISYYAHKYNSEWYSKIYKIGTGFNGTKKGQFYGALPNFYAPINNSLLYLSDDFIYVSDGDPFGLLKVNKFNGDTTRIILADGLLNWENAKVQIGSFYLSSDGNFVYNLASRDSLGIRHYILRTFNPKKHWSLAKPDMQISGTIYPGFSSFFVADGFLYPYENYQNGLMRRINISDGKFEEEWISYSPFQHYYSWCYDPINNIVYASEFSNENGSSRIASFKGKYIDAIGNATTTEIGPATKWNSLDFNIVDGNKSSNFKVSLFGKNISTNKWDTLKTDFTSPISMKFIEPNKYSYIKLGFNIWDSSFTPSSSITLKSIFVNYTSLPDISLLNDEMILSQDSVLQGVPVNVNLRLHNYGLSTADSVKLVISLNSNKLPFFSKTVSIPPDSEVDFSTTIQTDNLSSANIITAAAELPASEFFTFNNSVSKNLYIIKDSANPSMSVTFDGREILDGDIVSAKPVIVLTIKDNSIQQVDTSNFRIVLDGHPINFSGNDVKSTVTSNPFKQIEIEWTPLLKDGIHNLSFNVNNSSGYFSDSLKHTVQFYTFNKPDIQNIFNYPNPFKDYTNFTFQLAGSNVPEELTIQIFTVAGRYINTILVPGYNLHIGYNRIPWNGRDKDDNIIANGAYFYKITVKNNGIIKSVIQKLAKVG
ncbi:MAG TPA: C25 family cysteine peptidase, partial [Ignavibacteriaceae bacterium]|nr:C25 family cysteine peptidase [Ignavibacteriaceae bacterium]